MVKLSGLELKASVVDPFKLKTNLKMLGATTIIYLELSILTTATGLNFGNYPEQREREMYHTAVRREENPVLKSINWSAYYVFWPGRQLGYLAYDAFNNRDGN